MNFLNYAFGPALYMIYRTSEAQVSRTIEMSSLEKFGNFMISTLSILWGFGFYTSPCIGFYLYRRGYFQSEYIPAAIKLSTSIGVIFIASAIMRGIGRMNSHSYINMLKALEQAKSSKTSTIESRRELRGFDIDFKWWPVDFDANDVERTNTRRNSNMMKKKFTLNNLPCDVLAYIAIHTFGISMIYPGSFSLLQKLMRPMFLSGRARLIENNHGLRYKVKTADANEIDAIFIDNRNSRSLEQKGNTLIICCEGNAGFYEIGIMSTPLELNYSVLGWNHPGFACSTGTPYPNQDMNAIDAILQLAINHLGFAVEDIILYGWSIGGYSALYAGTSYPDVKGIILDATFDDILYLATERMPQVLSPVVKTAIRKYCNLNNTELALDYNGPILFIRRTDDEIIAEDGRIETNRGNFLVLNILKYRYPNIFQDALISRIKRLLNKPLEISPLSTAENGLCLSRLARYTSDQGKTYPMKIGADYSEDTRNQMATYLIYKHMYDFKSTHCTPLPSRLFNEPWDIPVEQGYVLG